MKHYMDLILSTRNPSKTRQIKLLLEGLPLSVLSLEDAGIPGDVVEDGATLEENAEKKARFAWEQKKTWSVADDTGLFIDALDGRPGIHAARWAGEGKTTEEIMQYTLDQLAPVPLEERTATFRTVAFLIAPDGTKRTFIGDVRGLLLTAPRVPCQPQMPYSPLFMPEGGTKVWAEMTTEEENAVSHRGRAFRHVRDFLTNHFA